VILVVTGLILDFPNFDQTRRVMQQANLVHLISALLGITVAFFHIYLGTIGQRGAYQAMRTGYVDEAWAKEHHSHWYADVKAGRSPQAFADDVPAETRSKVLEAFGRANETQPQKLFPCHRRQRRRCLALGRTDKPKQETKPRKKGARYEISAHVRKYYRTAKV